MQRIKFEFFHRANANLSILVHEVVSDSEWVLVAQWVSGTENPLVEVDAQLTGKLFAISADQGGARLKLGQCCKCSDYSYTIGFEDLDDNDGDYDDIGAYIEINNI